MNFEVVHVSRGDLRLRSGEKQIRVLGEALVPAVATDPSYVFYLDSLNNWTTPLTIALTESEKQDVIKAIRKHFHDQGSVIDFE